MHDAFVEKHRGTKCPCQRKQPPWESLVSGRLLPKLYLALTTIRILSSHSSFSTAHYQEYAMYIDREAHRSIFYINE